MNHTQQVEGQFTREERREGAVLVARNAPIFVRRRRQAQIGMAVFMLIFTVLFYESMQQRWWWIPIMLCMVLYFFTIKVLPGALQMMPSYPRTYQYYHFEWNAQGITRRDQTGHSDFFAWDASRQSFLLTGRFAIVFLSDEFSMYIPRRFFSEAQWSGLAAQWSTWIPQLKQRRGHGWLRGLIIVGLLLVAAYIGMLATR